MQSLMSNLYRKTVGFDSLFSLLGDSHNNNNYPVYNIISPKPGEYVIELAVAGFKKENLEVYLEDNLLEIRGTSKEQVDLKYLHKGISSRNFIRRFTVESDISIGEVALDSGILRIPLFKKTKETSKRRLEIMENL